MPQKADYQSRRREMLGPVAKRMVGQRQKGGRPQEAGLWANILRLFGRGRKASQKREKAKGTKGELATVNTKLKGMDKQLANWDILQSVPEIGPGGHTKPVSFDTLVARRRRLVAKRDSLTAVQKKKGA